ncbi:hypothetical protein [Streptomyces sp. NBC_00623]
MAITESVFSVDGDAAPLSGPRPLIRGGCLWVVVSTTSLGPQLLIGSM